MHSPADVDVKTAPEELGERPSSIDVSVVVPALDEAASLAELAQRIRESLRAIPKHEVIVVDDGSTDATWDVVARLHAQDARVKGVRLRQRSGKSAALAAGFGRAAGAIVVTMDGDLQDDPADIPRFLDSIAAGFDVVVGWKVRRKDGLARRILSRLFNVTARIATGLRAHDINNGFKAFRRDVLSRLPLYGDLFRFMIVFAAAEGYRVGEVPVTHHARRYGRSRYGAERVLHGFFDLLSVVFLTRFARRPMHLFGFVGFALLLLGLATDGYLSVLWIQGYRVGDQPLLLLGVLEIVLGIQFFCTGFVAEFLVYQHQHRAGTADLPIREEIS